MMPETVKLIITGPVALKELAALLTRLSEQYQKQHMPGSSTTYTTRMWEPMVRATEKGTFSVFFTESLR